VGQRWHSLLGDGLQPLTVTPDGKTHNMPRPRSIDDSADRHRMTVVLAADTMRLLEQAAEAQKVTVSEVIRQAIAAQLQK
jgi:hypothetical protein